MLCFDITFSHSPTVEKFWVSQGESNAGFWAHEVRVPMLGKHAKTYAFHLVQQTRYMHEYI